jgi:hypothetical protein
MDEQTVASMSEQTNYCTTKGLGWAFLVVVLMIAVVPVLMLMAMVGLEEYGRYCNVNILPCFGLN